MHMDSGIAHYNWGGPATTPTVTPAHSCSPHIVEHSPSIVSDGYLGRGLQ